jgi:hypothetical protein
MGNVTLTPEELEALLDRSAKKGARAALEELGLHDDSAAKDIEDIRELLASWRETRKATFRDSDHEPWYDGQADNGGSDGWVQNQRHEDGWQS